MYGKGLFVKGRPNLCLFWLSKFGYNGSPSDYPPGWLSRILARPVTSSLMLCNL